MADSPSRGLTRTRVLLAGVFAVPLLTALGLPLLPARGELPVFRPEPDRFPDSTLPLLQQTIGPAPSEQEQPLIAHLQIADLDGDGIPDLIVCDARKNQVLWERQAPRGHWEELVIGEDLLVPAHATVADLDGDGRLDVLVSVLGNIMPDNGFVGRVVWLRNTGAGRFVPQVILDGVRRVTDVQAGDLNGDGRLDLAVAVFGYQQGQILWLENLGGGRFLEHELLSTPGTVHVPLADFDGDGDLDIGALVSQDEEEVWGFENLGQGRFRPRLLDFTLNYDLGSVGLVRCDLNGDGRPDLLWVAGDAFEDVYMLPQPYHGCFWLENLGGWRFAKHRIAGLGGALAVAAGDMDGDGDQDVVLVSMFNDWSRPENASVIWIENDGQQNFRPFKIASAPMHLATVACGDLDGDGRADIVAGGLNLVPPFDRIGRVTAWFSRQQGPPP